MRIRLGKINLVLFVTNLQIFVVNPLIVEVRFDLEKEDERRNDDYQIRDDSYFLGDLDLLWI